MNRNGTTRSMRSAHKVRKMRTGTTDPKRGRQARARTRARKRAVALALPLVALALPLATTGPQGAAQGATGGQQAPPACAPSLQRAPQPPTFIRVLAPGQRFRVRGGFTDVHAYKRGGTAMCQVTYEDASHVWTHGHYRVTLDAPDGPRYFTNRSSRTVIVAVWQEG